MHANQLILEITRRCNMQCLHCMRGNAQRLDMTPAIVDRVFSQVESVSGLCLSGGEPSLAVPVVEEVTAAIRRHRVEVNNFYIVSNGKTTPARARKFALALLDLYSCLSYPEEELTGLTVSGDAWHEEVKIPEVYKGLGFFMKDRHGPRSEDGVILDGRAKLNGIGRREAQDMDPFDVEGFDGAGVDGEIRVNNDLYIAANGNVTSQCDMSFARMDGESLGNVLTEPLKDIILRWEAEYGRRKAVA
jgi:hypothetical protein